MGADINQYLLSANSVGIILLFFKEPINSWLAHKFLSKTKRKEKRQERDRQVLIRLHEYQTRYFAIMAQMSLMGFFWKTTKDLSYKKSFEDARNRLGQDKCDISFAELSPEIRKRLESLGDVNKWLEKAKLRKIEKPSKSQGKDVSW